MAVRTTAAAVTLLLRKTPAKDLASFIETASSVVDDLAAIATTLTAAKLEQIERYLTAHVYEISVPDVNSESVKGVSRKFRGKTDLGLNLTHFGQMAMIIDTTGTLRKMSRRGAVTPSADWLGYEHDETPTEINI